VLKSNSKCSFTEYVNRICDTLPALPADCTRKEYAGGVPRRYATTLPQREQMQAALPVPYASQHRVRAATIFIRFRLPIIGLIEF
jgi:hypothetical protein